MQAWVAACRVQAVAGPPSEARRALESRACGAAEAWAEPPPRSWRPVPAARHMARRASRAASAGRLASRRCIRPVSASTHSVFWFVDDFFHDTRLFWTCVSYVCIGICNEFDAQVIYWFGKRCDTEKSVGDEIHVI